MPSLYEMTSDKQRQLMLKLKILLLALIPVLGLAGPGSPGSKYVEMTGELFKKADQAYLSITLKNEKKWHTYWKNPGDAGLPIKFNFRINEKPVQFKELEWPLPKKYLEEGDILTYGYEGAQSFFFKLSSDQLKKAKDFGILAHATYLVCKDICIPGESSATFKAPENLPAPSDVTQEAFEALPKSGNFPNNLELFLGQGKGADNLELQYTLKNVSVEDIDRNLNLITPFNSDLVTFKREKLYFDSKTNTLYGVMRVEWDGKYEEPARPLPQDGVFKKPVKMKLLFRGKKSERPVVFEKSFDQYSLGGQKAFAEFLKVLDPLDGDASAPKKASDSSIFTALLFAFLGGLILNLMPCVLPVISLKLFGLIAHSDEKKGQVLKHNLAYTGGIVSTFWALAAVVLGLKMAGETIGWGFQLQSPIFVFIMMIVIFVLALNMLGLFEFVTPGGSKLGNAQMKKGMSADFINGVLATILSTPCSAPFLGTALTFAFTTSNFNIFLTLTFVGLGLAFPFILTGVFPKLISFLPKPGMWMEKLKNVLGLTLLLTFVWLYDILSSQIDYSFAGIYVNTIFTMIFFAFFFRKFITKNKIMNLIVFLIPLALTVSLSKTGGLEVSNVDHESSQHGNLDWKKWSRQAMKDRQGEYVFMDFTADWCLTCKVNEKLVLNTEDFENLVKDRDLKLLLGDWTKRDDEITSFLREHDIVGVPAYFIQTPEGKIIKLGETISIDKIKKNLE